MEYIQSINKKGSKKDRDIELEIRLVKQLTAGTPEKTVTDYFLGFFKFAVEVPKTRKILKLLESEKKNCEKLEKKRNQIDAQTKAYTALEQAFEKCSRLNRLTKAAKLRPEKGKRNAFDASMDNIKDKTKRDRRLLRRELISQIDVALKSTKHLPKDFEKEIRNFMKSLRTELSKKHKSKIEKETIRKCALKFGELQRKLSKLKGKAYRSLIKASGTLQTVSKPSITKAEKTNKKVDKHFTQIEKKQEQDKIAQIEKAKQDKIKTLQKENEALEMRNFELEWKWQIIVTSWECLTKSNSVKLELKTFILRRLRQISTICPNGSTGK